MGQNDSDPVIAHNLGRFSPWLIVCDHAGREVPAALGDLGLQADAFERHIAWDIGAGALALLLGQALDAPVIRQRYSRLVIDCNRAPERADAIPEVSDGTIIPANAGLSEADRAERVRAVHTPYHAAIEKAVNARLAANLLPALLSVHSFTPQLSGGVPRPWRYGVLHDRRSRLSNAALARLAAEGEVVGDNQPYAMDDIDYTAPRHAIARGLEYLELEVRQDLIADEAGQTAIAAQLARLLPACLADVT